MKVGIITYHYVKNYGGMLQAYALKEVSKLRFNNITNIIDYRPKILLKPYSIINLSSVKSFIKTSIISPYTFIKYHRFNKFIRKFGDLSNYTYKTEKELKKTNKDYDAYITGSDQIWNTRITGELLDSYSLNFVDNQKTKISYAASIGNSSIEEKYINQYKEKLNKLDAISVREKTAKEVLDKILNKDIFVTLDPTLLLTKEEWNQIAINPKIKDKYILVYCLEINEEIHKIVQYLSEETGLQVITFGIRNKYKNGTKSVFTSGPREFVGLFKNAEYVVTNSFHGTTFSIIYNKKFYTVPHSQRGSRMIDLLKKLNIENRIFNNLQELLKIDYNFKTNYAEVEKKLEEERKKSLKFLEKALDNSI